MCAWVSCYLSADGAANIRRGGCGCGTNGGMNKIKELLLPLAGLIVVVGLLVITFKGGFTGRDSARPASSPGDLGVAQGVGEPASSEPNDAGRAGSGSTELLAMLNGLKVAKRERGADYDRNFFGEGWVDVDNNTCFTRADILSRDLEGVKKQGRCKVQSGTLHEPYTGKTIAYQSGKDTSEEVQIDHVVALLDAWGTGAQQWDETTRIAFANDPLNLLAVDGPTNDDKGHKNAAKWLPPNKSFHCHYVARQIAVKSRYGLWVTTDERDAMANVLKTCPYMMRVTGNTIVDDTP